MTDGPKSFFLAPEIHDYLVAHGSPPDDVLVDLIAETAALGPVAGMQVAPEQGALLTFLVAALDVRFAVEVGTFTGYSAVCIARGLRHDGRLLCCDVSEEWTAIARRAFAAAGVDDRIDLRIAPATETLASLPDDPAIDFAFIDADKPSYPQYYEAILARISPRGVIVVDNVLWGGRVVDPDADDEHTVAIRAFNDLVATDTRVDAVMLPVSDGLTLIRKR